MHFYPVLSQYTESASLCAKKFITDFKEKIRCEQIHAAAHFALKTLAIGSALWLNPAFFWGSVCVGVLWDKQVKTKFDEVWVAFKDHYYRVVCVSALLAVIKLPVALLTYSICIGLKLGCSLKNSAGENSQTTPTVVNNILNVNIFHVYRT